MMSFIFSLDRLSETLNDVEHEFLVLVEHSQFAGDAEKAAQLLLSVSSTLTSLRLLVAGCHADWRREAGVARVKEEIPF